MRGSLLLLLAPLVGAALLETRGSPDDCPGYKVVNVREKDHSFEADLTIAGDHCDVYGTDLENLKLFVEYQTDDRLHVLISDLEEDVYQVPTSVLRRPDANGDHHDNKPNIRFDYEEEPFSFRYLRLRTWLPADPYLYGLGEHTDSLRLPNKNYTRTLWSRDAYGIPENTNLYGNHPIYVDHRGDDGTHGVFFLNSNGMDIKIDQADDGRQYLEYNTIGGVLDFYFLAGPTPKEVAKQYSEVVGLPAMQAYWTFGYHNCRYGYQDVYDVAEVVYNYSRAHIPLETMWTDIDYMDRRRVFTLDPERFPLEKMRELVDHLHKHDQHYIVMVDPAVSDSDNGAANRGKEQGIFLTRGEELYQGAVWPGVTVYPDWFNPGTQEWWDNEFARFFDPAKGVDIDGLWIDMNEAANFCPWPCKDPAAYAEENDLPPAAPAVRDSSPRPLPGFPSDFQPKKSPTVKRSASGKTRRAKGTKAGLPDRNLLSPPYQIANAAGSLSNKTIDTDLVHEGGDSFVEYDTHNLYGTMMSSASRQAMVLRRPDVRPLVITRSTFAGAGAHVGHWLGDNLSQWDKYRVSISQMLAFASIFQIPMVGSDVCGFGGNTTEELCARWATLGAFNPFYRNHNELGAIPQEFYRWPTVANAARKAIETRYRLLDYLYTAFHRQTQTGEPFLQPLLPVQDVGQTSVDAYFPNDVFYDWNSGAVIHGQGATVHLDNIDVTEIPIHIRGGSVIPLRSKSAMTTAELRRRGFEILVAPNQSGYASGSLYLDDGESLDTASSLIEFEYNRGHLTIRGQFGYRANVVIESVTVLRQSRPWKAKRGVEFDAAKHSITKKVDIDLSGPAEIDI
ncbi:alpha/beta-glucosidase agdC [Penicillium subrubescens]|uniref:alpha/beta-glucosidase agdC n=1 Tax=Penicillium subrubescens TaxID=1316194 RepID=UPI0025454478|nr:alpha/beta-glucosidase agdC [Penicillium subrubescens]KAJ5883535.1 alpha/beta-glucosidase agdC [Penicillium subrubescens]